MWHICSTIEQACVTMKDHERLSDVSHLSLSPSTTGREVRVIRTKNLDQSSSYCNISPQLTISKSKQPRAQTSQGCPAPCRFRRSNSGWSFLFALEINSISGLLLNSVPLQNHSHKHELFHSVAFAQSVRGTVMPLHETVVFNP